MSIRDAQRVIALEQQVVELRANVAALTDMHIGLTTRFEAHLMAESPAAATGAPGAVPVPQQPCPRCEQRRQQAQTRLHRHRTKAAAVDGETLQDAIAGNVAGEPSPVV
jgi:hypothetical protein